MGANTLEHAPPPPRSVLFAALTIASIASFVMSPRHMATFIRDGWTWQLSATSVHTRNVPAARRHPLLAGGKAQEAEGGFGTLHHARAQATAFNMQSRTAGAVSHLGVKHRVWHDSRRRQAVGVAYGVFVALSLPGGCGTLHQAVRYCRAHGQLVYQR
jgi:hypothetical protein